MNTTKLYNAMKRYTDTLLDAHAEYMATMDKYKTAKGSQYYVEKQEAARKKRREATEAIKAETLRQVDDAINAMLTRAATRKATPLTADQLAICQAIKLRDKVTLDELITAENAMEGNLSGLSIIQEAAQKSGVMHNFLADAKGLNGETLERSIRQMRNTCYSIIGSDGASRAQTLAAKYHANHYGGGTVDQDAIPRINRYQDESDFLSSVVMTGVNVADFSEAVNE